MQLEVCAERDSDALVTTDSSILYPTLIHNSFIQIDQICLFVRFWQAINEWTANMYASYKKGLHNHLLLNYENILTTNLFPFAARVSVNNSNITPSETTFN